MLKKNKETKINIYKIKYYALFERKYTQQARCLDRGLHSRSASFQLKCIINTGMDGYK